jgi:hypothetical protein
LAAFPGGCKDEPIGDNGCPADFDMKIFAVSWTARESSGFPIGIFSQLPFIKGGQGGFYGET